MQAKERPAKGKNPIRILYYVNTLVNATIFPIHMVIWFLHCVDFYFTSSRAEENVFFLSALQTLSPGHFFHTLRKTKILSAI